MDKVLLIADIPVAAIGLADIVDREFKGAVLTVSGSYGEAKRVLGENGGHRLVVFCLVRCGPLEVAEMIDIARCHPGTPMMALSEKVGPGFLKELYVAGMKGYLDLSAKKEEVAAALLQVSQGMIYLGQDTLKAFISQRKPVAGPATGLTTRQAVVVKLMMEGKSNKQIGGILQLKPSTVSTFKTKIFKKLGVANIFELLQKKGYMMN